MSGKGRSFSFNQIGGCILSCTVYFPALTVFYNLKLEVCLVIMFSLNFPFYPLTISTLSLYLTSHCRLPPLYHRPHPGGHPPPRPDHLTPYHGSLLLVDLDDGSLHFLRCLTPRRSRSKNMELPSIFSPFFQFRSHLCGMFKFEASAQSI